MGNWQLQVSLSERLLQSKQHIDQIDHSSFNAFEVKQPFRDDGPCEYRLQQDDSLFHLGRTLLGTHFHLSWNISILRSYEGKINQISSIVAVLG
jgi:hypothetical protein